MMSQSLSRMKIAMLASSGFEENHLISMQKAMREAGAIMSVVSTEKGMMTALNNGQWGHNHTIDAQLNTALGVDYDVLIIAGGESSHAKLMETAHTQRFVGSFMASKKPVVAMGDASEMLTQMGMMEDSVLVMADITDASIASMMDYMMATADMDEAA